MKNERPEKGSSYTAFHLNAQWSVARVVKYAEHSLVSGV